MKMGAIQIEADSEEEAKKKLKFWQKKPSSVIWEDSWNAVDACVV